MLYDTTAACDDYISGTGSTVFHEASLSLNLISVDTDTKQYKKVNPYSLNVIFLYSLKTSENRRFSDVFRGYRNVTLGEYGLIRFWRIYQNHGKHQKVFVAVQSAVIDPLTLAKLKILGFVTIQFHLYLTI